MKNFSFLVCTCALLVTCCEKPTPTPEPTTELSSVFSDTPTTSPVSPSDALAEASGLADSQKQPGLLWTHGDAASPDELYLLNRQGALAGTVKTPFYNYDWEDVAVGPGPTMNESYVYIADIGDNTNNREIKNVYRFVEPNTTSGSVGAYDRVQFRYPDGTFDAETLLLDPLTKDLYIVTKWLPQATVYRLPYPQSTSAVMTAEKVATMTVGNDLTGGSISTIGTEIIVRGYTAIYYWQRKTTESIAEVLQREPTKKLPYIFEPQGEAVCFDKDNKGYFTLSERRNVTSVNLYFYARK